MDKNDTATATLDNKVKRVIANIRNLPTPPMVFHQIQKVINDPRVNATHVASILSEDPAMSVKVLRLTNSAFYGLAKEIESVRQAVVIIGFEAIKNLVLSASVLDMFQGKKVDQEFQNQFWRHSLATALVCRLLSRKVRSMGVVDGDAGFSAGLLHDVGKMIISCYMPAESALLAEARKAGDSRPDNELEQELFGFTHASIGSYLAEQWKIPHKLAEAIAYHHNPEDYPGHEPMAYLVYFANYISKRTFQLPDGTNLLRAPNPALMAKLDITDADMDLYSEQLMDEYAKAETFIHMAGIK